MGKHVLTDTGFWFALYEPKDSYYQKANKIAEHISEHNFLIPWPSLYETLNTRFTRRSGRMIRFKNLLTKPNVSLIEDYDYKERALNLTFNYSRFGKRTFSLVDVIIREALKDKSLRIDYLITFNAKDFIDICQKRKIEILYE